VDHHARQGRCGPGHRGHGLWVALILAAFTIAFGTRHLDAAEHHEGMVAAIAFESLVKLLAFLAVGAFVTFGIYNGFGDLFGRAARSEAERDDESAGRRGRGYASWVWLTILSMMAIMFLPRQFQVAVIENVNEKHLNKAIWLFPLYMLAINIFVLPIAFGGLLHFPEGKVDADTFVLALPMSEKQECSRCWCSSAGCRRRPGWSSSKRSRSRQWCATTSSCRCCCGCAACGSPSAAT
jgi:Na+/proline symporter